MSVCVECGKPMCRFEDCKFLHTGNCRYCHVEYHDDDFIPKICINIDDWIDESSQNMDLRELSMGYDAKIDWYVRYHPEKVETILELFEKMISTDIEADNLRGQSLVCKNYHGY